MSQTVFIFKQPTALYSPVPAVMAPSPRGLPTYYNVNRSSQATQNLRLTVTDSNRMLKVSRAFSIGSDHRPAISQNPCPPPVNDNHRLDSNSHPTNQRIVLGPLAAAAQVIRDDLALHAFHARSRVPDIPAAH